MAFTHLLSPMKVGNKVTKSYRKCTDGIQSGSTESDGSRGFLSKIGRTCKGRKCCVILGETDVNFRDAVRIPGFKPLTLQNRKRIWIHSMR